MRVLHLDHTTGRGGAELALARTLASAGDLWEATLLVPLGTPAGAFRELGRLPNFAVIRLGPEHPAGAASSKKLGRSFRAFATVLQAAAAIRRSEAFHRADIVHANTSRSALYGALACAGTSKRFVVHLRDMVSAESLGRLGCSLFTRMALPRANGVVANSRATAATASGFLSKGVPIEVIPSASGLRRERPPVTVARQVRTVGMLARIDQWKGHELLLQAFADVFRGTTVRLKVAGAPEFGKESYLAELVRIAEALGIGTQVDFLGHVTDVDGFVDELDVCVQASIRPEPLGQNVLQYLAASKPAIATRAGGPTEWITDGVNGILFTMGDRTSLADALRSVQSQEMRRSLALGARATPGLLDDRGAAEAQYRFYRRL